MAATGKRLIPVELLRRSCRNHKPTSSAHHQRFVKEEPIEATIVGAASKDAFKVETNRVERTHKIVEGEPFVAEQEDCKTDVLSSKRLLTLQPDGFLTVNCDELDLERTLMGGQSFRWTKSIGDDGNQLTFTGVVGKDVLQLWRYDEQRIAFKKLNREQLEASESRLVAILEDYFQLKYKLTDLYEDWSRRDKHFAKCSQFYGGFRILRQDPVENVFSFICATNNNIKRISLMIDKMCQNFGDPLLTGNEAKIGTTYRTFPTVERLAHADVFNSLRYDLGFGYRAKFICETAKKVVALSKSSKLSPSNYLVSLRELPYKETCKELQEFPGIGRKVADCICLMSMDHLQSVPIDCHIYEIVCRTYMPNLRQERKTLTESVHDLIGNYFTDLHGPLAGWATSVLFIAELKHLKQENLGADGTTSKRNVPAKTPQKKRKS